MKACRGTDFSTSSRFDADEDDLRELADFGERHSNEA